MNKLLLTILCCLAAVSTALAGPAVDDLIKLARSGVDGEVLLAFVETSPVPFDLSADDIITLKDLGVPAKVINAALYRSQVLDSTAAAQGATAAEPNAQVAPPAERLNMSFFYDVLAPYGRWISIDGDWCWQPAAGLISADWAPYYSRGHWVYTDWGWCWVSDYSWGWVPFHYGRWFHHSRYGWCWWPDNEWGPAWVAWRYGGGYWGWAPLPRHIRYVHNHGFYHGKRRLRHGDDFGLDVNVFFFLPLTHMADPRPWIHIVPPKRARDIYRLTAFDPDGFGDARGHFFNRGPKPEAVATASQKPVTPVTIINKILKPGQPIPKDKLLPNGLEIYTPKITPDIPRPPAKPPVANGGLTDDIAQRRREATQSTLERKNAEAAAAERERKALIDSAQRERDQRKREELNIEATVRDQRAQQARDNMERIKQWEPAPAAPLPHIQQPPLQDETRRQVQNDAREEQDKQTAMEDLLRKPVLPGKPVVPVPPGDGGKPKGER